MLCSFAVFLFLMLFLQLWSLLFLLLFLLNGNCNKKNFASSSLCCWCYFSAYIHDAQVLDITIVIIIAADCTTLAMVISFAVSCCCSCVAICPTYRNFISLYVLLVLLLLLLYYYFCLFDLLRGCLLLLLPFYFFYNPS